MRCPALRSSPRPQTAPCGTLGAEVTSVIDVSLRVPRTAVMVGGGSAVAHGDLSAIASLSAMHSTKSELTLIIRGIVGNAYRTADIGIGLPIRGSRE